MVAVSKNSTPARTDQGSLFSPAQKGAESNNDTQPGKCEFEIYAQSDFSLCRCETNSSSQVSKSRKRDSMSPVSRWIERNFIHTQAPAKGPELKLPASTRAPPDHSLAAPKKIRFHRVFG
jgi:hypothetical protein